MPLPWKKTRVSRISRFVADLQSPKRGNSLVVETGFPTSLVDLFVKNRERLKKSSKKKRNKQQERSIDEEEELVISDPIPLSNSLDLAVLTDSVYVEHRIARPENLGEQRKLVSEDQESRDLFNQTTVEEECVTLVEYNKTCPNETERNTLAAVLKIFGLIVLALSTTKLAVGITMSAFALIFLEYVGKRVPCFPRPCSNTRFVLKPLLQKGSSLFCVKVRNCDDLSKRSMVIQEKDEDATDCCDLIEPLELDSCVEEIQVVESNFEVAVGIKENRRVELEFDLLACEAEANGSGKQSSRRARIRMKMKKLVPKRLRSGKKGKERPDSNSDIFSEASSRWEEQEICSEILLEPLQKQEGKGKEFERKEPESNHQISVTSAGVLAKPEEAKAEMLVVEERMKIERKGNFSYPSLFLIALAGLAGGRTLALVLTVVSCLMIKLVGRQKRCVNSEKMNRISPASI